MTNENHEQYLKFMQRFALAKTAKVIEVEKKFERVAIIALQDFVNRSNRGSNVFKSDISLKFV